MTEQRYRIADELQARRIGALVSGLNQAAGPWEVTVRKYVKKRTNPQNALYWKWLTIIGESTGYDKDELHDVLREKFLPWHDVEIFGKVRRVLTSTSSRDFKTSDMTAYMSHIERFAATDLGIILPRPEDEHYASMPEAYRSS